MNVDVDGSYAVAAGKVRFCGRLRDLIAVMKMGVEHADSACSARRIFTPLCGVMARELLVARSSGEGMTSQLARERRQYVSELHDELVFKFVVQLGNSPGCLMTLCYRMQTVCWRTAVFMCSTSAFESLPRRVTWRLLSLQHGEDSNSRDSSDVGN